MHARHAVVGVLAAAFAASAACGGAAAPDPNLPEIVARSIAYHGGALYESSRMTMKITSLSGSFDIEATRNGGEFEFIVTDPARGDRPERRVRLNNDGVTEWRGGAEVELDAEGERRATAFANARVFFPLLPYTLKGGDIHFEDRGLDRWDGRDLHRMRVSFTPGTSNERGRRLHLLVRPGDRPHRAVRLRLRQRASASAGRSRSSGSAACSSPTRTTTPSTAARCRSTR